MNIKKTQQPQYAFPFFVGKPANWYNSIVQNQTEVTHMASASETKIVSEILPATVNSEYKQVLVDGSATNMDEGTVYRGPGVITGNKSSSGTEPSIMRSEDEEADVTRGAGFMFAADALSINPDISVDLLRWGEPNWVTDAFSVSRENGFKARYKWYKAALDKAYDTYGIKFAHISADYNEAAKDDTESEARCNA